MQFLHLKFDQMHKNYEHSENNECVQNAQKISKAIVYGAQKTIDQMGSVCYNKTIPGAQGVKK